MNNKLLGILESLENKIKSSYEIGVTMEEAEKLAAEFLHAQLLVSNELKVVDLDARMQKSGFKAVTATVYLEIIAKSDKKPTESNIEAVINTTKLVQDSRDQLDTAEVNRDSLQNYLSIFKEAHVYFRGIAKGRFE